MLDEIDSEILGLLQSEGRMSQRELGARVGLSPNAAGARVQRLVDRRIITGFHAAVSPEALGRPIEASIDVWLDDRRNDSSFIELVRGDARIVEAFHLTGPLDFRIRVWVESTSDLNNLLTRMQTEGGVRQTDSRLVLQQLPVQPEVPGRGG